MQEAVESDGELVRRLESMLGEAAAASVRITELRVLPGGACQDNLKIALELDGEPLTGVLRSDARTSLPGSLPRRIEFEVIRLATAAGVQTATARWLLRDALRPGADAVFLDWSEGVAIGAKITRDPRLAEARTRLPAQLAASLVGIHSIHPADAPGLHLDVPQSATSERSAVAAALHFNRTMIDTLPEPHPAMELTHRWLGEHAPAERPQCLVHGDFRTGNFLVGEGGLHAVLDWEFAHWGSPAADLGWLSVRDWRFGALAKPIGGFADRATFYSAYEAAGGGPVDPVEVHWWEVVGNLRWAAGACYQAERVLRGDEGDLELLAIGRRACEMEFEALRLIDVGPSA